MIKYYGVCSHCNKWGEAPVNFDQTKHFLKCGNCNSPMYLHTANPQEAGYKILDRTDVGVMKAPKH